MDSTPKEWQGPANIQEPGARTEAGQLDSEAERLEHIIGQGRVD